MSSDEEYVQDASDDGHNVTSTYDTRSGRNPIAAPRGTARPPRRNGRSSLAAAAAANSSSSSAARPNGSRKDKQQHARAAWEDVKRSWDTVVESADGSLAANGAGGAWQLEADARRRLLRDTTPLQRGIIRHVILVLDSSFAMAEKDMLPHRHNRATALACDFVRQFFEQNPISQLGIVGMRDGIAVRISDVGGNPELHVERLREWQREEPRGNPSLQNALEMCRGALYHAPSHGTREVLIIYGALLSSDPGNIHTTLASLVADRIRVSIIGLSAHLAICAELCTRTNAGDASTYRVALDEVHLRDLLLAATTPPVSRSLEHSVPSLLMMGFPSRTLAGRSGGGGGGGGVAGPVFCECHNTPVREGYPCTRCGARVCKLPAVCPACGLTLILSTHLARSYHHLFPLRNWVNVSWADVAANPSEACFSCLAPFPAPPRHHRPPPQANGPVADGINRRINDVTSNGPPRSRPNRGPDDAVDDSTGRGSVKGISESGRYACVVCRNHFCIDCDVFSHEVLHNCPGCQSLPQPA